MPRLADDVVKEELNVKALHTVTAGSDLVDVTIHPLPKQSAKSMAAIPGDPAALAALDPLARGRAVEAGKPVTVSVDGEMVTVLPDEVQVRKCPKPGLAVAEDAGYLVAVTTELTDELRWEGWAREVSRNIQELRKKSGLEIAIASARPCKPSKLVPVWQQFGAVIAADTLSIDFDQAEPASGAFTASLKLDGEDVGVRDQEGVVGCWKLEIGGRNSKPMPASSF